MRLGIFGGTFNPLHIGHMVLADEAAAQMKLDRLLFVPSFLPPHKESLPLVRAKHRYAMIQAVIGGIPHFEACDFEISRETPSYTIETISFLKQHYGESMTPFFITGSDSFLDIHTWRDYERLLEMMNFIVAIRPETVIDRLASMPGLATRQANLRVPGGHEKWHSPTLILDSEPNRSNSLYLLRIPAMQISSTDIRSRIKQGQPYRFHVPEDVYRYIERYSLYRNPMVG